MTSRPTQDYKYSQQLKHPRRYAPIRPEQRDRFNRNTRAESFGIRGRLPSEQQGGIVGIRSKYMKRKIAIIVVLFLVLLFLYFSVSYFYPIFHFLFVKDKATQEIRSKQYADMKKYLEEYDVLVKPGDAWQASQNTAVLSSAPGKGTSVEPKNGR